MNVPLSTALAIVGNTPAAAGADVRTRRVRYFSFSPALLAVPARAPRGAWSPRGFGISGTPGRWCAHPDRGVSQWSVRTRGVRVLKSLHSCTDHS
jgi:hypothetical protein